MEQSQQQSEALESNASESQPLVPDNSIDGEYVETAASQERKVEPISGAVLSSPGTTMQQLHEMAKHELNVLDALNNDGRQIIKTRLMAIWEEMSVRFERGESINGISGTGGKGMGKYLRSIGIDPAKRRSWKFEIRQQEALRLAQENPPIRAKRTSKKEIIINGETEADLIAKAGVRMAQLLAGDNMTPPQERVNKAGAMAKDILEAVVDGQYARLEPLPLPTETLAPEAASFEDWQKHQFPTPEYKLKSFADASENFSRGYTHSFQKSGFKKIIDVLRDKPDQVRSNAQDFAQLAMVLRGVAENANLLAAAISKALTPSPGPLPTTEPEEQPAEQNTDQTDFDLDTLLNEEHEPQTSEFESPTPAAKPDAEVVSTTKVGDKSEPTRHGFYSEFVKDENPYAVRDLNNPNLGILHKLKSKAEADKYMNDREREAAACEEQSTARTAEKADGVSNTYCDDSSMVERPVQLGNGGSTPTSSLHFVRIEKALATELVIKHHYLHRKPLVSWAFGIIRDSQLVGVCTFGKPMWSVQVGVTGGALSDVRKNKGRWRDVFELNRLWIADDVTDHCIESKFVAWCLRELKKENPNLILISYADGSVTNSVTQKNHVGVVYQAGGWIYTGLSSPWVDITIEGTAGERKLLLANASGLTWIDNQRLLFSEIREGFHMGSVTAGPARVG